MASIVLSFVGNQDPLAATDTEGSICTLLRFLLTEKQKTIKKVILLYTEGTQTKAKDTQDYIESEPDLRSLALELRATSAKLSRDPTDLRGAAEEAREGLKLVQEDMAPGDHIEFNASSGTPAMKSSFSLLQAAGYVTHGTVWQVRNPREMRPGQDHVFETDVSVLRWEFDLSLIHI